MRASRHKLVKLVAGVLVGSSAVLLAYALLSPEPVSSDTDHMGMGQHMTYTLANVGLVALALVGMVASLMVILLWEGYEPLPGTTGFPAPPPAPSPSPTKESSKEQTGDETSHDRAASKDLPGVYYLVLRLLTGDERTMFKAIMDSGGEALQKDLILKTRMSHAKVSRVLDRLEMKGVISKERHG